MPNETKQSCATAYKTMIGGQALIEGIMMLGPEKKAVVVRKPDGGLEEQVEERVLIKDKHPALGLPLLRGVFNFCSSLANGVKALMYSASFSRRTRRSRRSPPGSSSGWTDTWAARRPPPFLSPWRWCWASFSPWGCSSCCPPPSPDWWAWTFPCPCGCATCWRAWCVSSSSWAI